MHKAHRRTTNSTKRTMSTKNKKLLKEMIQLASLTREGFSNGDISTLMSPRTVISWAENWLIFKDVKRSFSISFLNKCDDTEKPIIAEYFQRCFGEDLEESHSPASK